MIWPPPTKSGAGRWRPCRGGVSSSGDGGVAHLAEVEAADLAGHAHGDALLGVRQNGSGRSPAAGWAPWWCCRSCPQSPRIVVDIAEQLLADGGQLGLGVTAGGVGHIAGVGLAEVALAVHKGVQQRFRCRGPGAPWCRRWRSPWGFRCMVWPTMLAVLVRRRSADPSCTWCTAACGGRA